MLRNSKGRLAAVILGLVSSAALAQPAVAAAPPAPAPAAPAAVTPVVDTPKPIKFVTPPGYKQILDGSMTIVFEPNDEEWVKKGLAEAKKNLIEKDDKGVVVMDAAGKPKPLHPKGGPADMLVKNLVENRANLVKQITADLGLADDRAANSLIDEKVIPNLVKYDKMQVPIFYLVTTQDKLKTLVKNGWGDDRKFHYNRVADAVAYDDNISFSTDEKKPGDDIVRVLFYNDKDEKETPEKRQTGLGNVIANTEMKVAVEVAKQAFPSTFQVVSKWIEETQFGSMKLGRDQIWLKLGISNFLAAKYSDLITGLPKQEFLKPFLTEDKDVLIRAMSVDLSAPLDPSKIQPGVGLSYDEALKKKAVLVTAFIVDRSDSKSIPNILASIRKQMPVDGKALIDAIKKATDTGSDLDKVVAAQ